MTSDFEEKFSVRYKSIVGITFLINTIINFVPLI